MQLFQWRELVDFKFFWLPLHEEPRSMCLLGSANMLMWTGAWNNLRALRASRYQPFCTYIWASLQKEAFVSPFYRWNWGFERLNESPRVHALGKLGFKITLLPLLPPICLNSYQSIYLDSEKVEKAWEGIHLFTYALLYFFYHKYCIFYRFAATLHGASLSAPSFQRHLVTSCLCVTFW